MAHSILAAATLAVVSTVATPPVRQGQQAASAMFEPVGGTRTASE